MAGSSIVFVHGSFFSAWTWIPVIERLSRHGIDCHALELPFTSLRDDVEALSARVDELSAGGVTVVSHSYTGITASLAARRAQHLVFIAARMPAVGESQTELSPTWGNPDFRHCLQVSDDGDLSLADDAATYLFHRSPLSLARLAMENRRSMRSEIPAEPIAEPAWTKVPSSYLVCTDDRAVQVQQQRTRASWAKNSIEIDADHSPFFSAPDETAQFILQTHLAEVGR